jgi:ADP-dependent NAD(P)H-hydrate dehydratase / NAD(P)H-hydrate epimerase
MSWLRENAGAIVTAVDLPSGIDLETGESGDCHVTADVTFMIANAKSSLLFGRAANAAGALAIVPVGILKCEGAGDLELISPQTLDFGKSPRTFDFHKGMAGRVSIIAGSPPYTGAAVLAATGALRGGAGLVTLHVPMGLASRVLSRCPPEIIVREISSLLDTIDSPADAWVIGCGLGGMDAEFQAELFAVIASSAVPTVLDADALNLIARAGKIGILRANHVITPHPGEFFRLAPHLADQRREQAARIFRENHPSTLLLKGSRTIVTQQGMALWCNSTGHPGMATGGQGDLLSGVIGALLAAGRTGPQAAALGAWLCGRASEIAIWHDGVAAESLIPTDTAKRIGAAFLDWRRSAR